MGAFAHFLRSPEHVSDSKEVISACKPSDSQTDKSEGAHWEPLSCPLTKLLCSEDLRGAPCLKLPELHKTPAHW